MVNEVSITPVTAQNRTKLLIRGLLAAGLILLPLSHFRWLPNLGTTRPLSAFFFLLATVLLVFQSLLDYRLTGLQPRFWTAWKIWLTSLPGWKLWRWWLLLVFIGLFSSVLTLLYGNFLQALNRLFGYSLILMYLLVGAWGLKLFGIRMIAHWIAVGYLLILPYAALEVLTLLHIPRAVSAVLWVRSILVTSYPFVNRSALLATEPSFVGFQLLLLLALFPFLESRLVKWLIGLLIAVSGILTLSGTNYAIIGLYFAALLFFRQKRQMRVRIALAAIAVAVLAVTAYLAIPTVKDQVQQAETRALSIERFKGAYYSSKIRNSYVQNLIYAMIETKGLGLGIGQYGQFWKDIYVRHINYHSFDRFNEITNALNSPDYMRPYSVIFGIGADLGLLGMAVLAAFFVQLFKGLRSPHGIAVCLAGLLALSGAYPIVTPHIWLAFALMWGLAAAAQVDPKKTALETEEQA